MIVIGGSTDVTTYFAMRLAADGTNATGLTISDFDLQYVRSGATPAAKADAVALAATNTAHTDNRGIEIDATDQPGLYRFDWPDAAFAAGVREVILSVKHTSCFTEHLRVEIDPVGLALTAYDAPTADEVADALLDRTAGVETGLTPRQFFRLATAVLFGKASGLDGATAVYRDFGDTKDRISATVDADGNRTAVTRDAT